LTTFVNALIVGLAAQRNTMLSRHSA